MNLAIIGGGMISSDLASFLNKKGHQITIVLRYPEKLHSFSRIAAKSIMIKNSDEDEFLPIIKNNPLLLVTLAAEPSEESALACNHIAHAMRRIALKNSFTKRLIYVGSTSVYGDHRGLWVDETSPLKTTAPGGKSLIEAERLFQSLAELGWSVCILRIAELYGPSRELSKRLKKFQGALPGSGAIYTNMIHRADVLSGIDYAIGHHLEGIFNLVDDEHPTRKQLYTQIAKQFHLPEIKWDQNLNGFHLGNKRVSNHKIKSVGFSLRFPKRLLE